MLSKTSPIVNFLSVWMNLKAILVIDSSDWTAEIRHFDRAICSLFRQSRSHYVKPQIDVIKLIIMQVNNTIIVLQNGKQNYSLTGRVLDVRYQRNQTNKLARVLDVRYQRNQTNKLARVLVLSFYSWYLHYFELMHFNNNLTYVY